MPSLILLILAALQDEPRVVIVSIDGLRPEFYLSEDYDAPTIRGMAMGGAHAKGVEGVYPSVTYASHATIVTGVRPARHGIYGNTKMGENGGTPEWYWETKDLKARTLWQAAREKDLKVAITYWPSTVGADVNWVVPERWSISKDHTTADLLMKHSTPGLIPELVKALGLPDLSDKRKDLIDEFISGAAAYVLKTHKPNLLFVHLIQVDDAQHKYGRDAKEVKEALQRMDKNIAKIVKAAPEGTIFAIVGDHGFFDVDREVAPNTLLAEAGLIELEDRKVKSWKAIGHTQTGSMAVYAKDEGAAKRAKEVLEAGAVVDGKRHFTVIDRKRLDELGYNPSAAFAIEAEEGVALIGAASGKLLAGKPGSKGQHGYLPTHPKLHTGFILSGGGIRATAIEKMRLVDIAPTIAKILGIEMKDVEGSALDLSK